MTEKTKFGPGASLTKKELVAYIAANKNIIREGLSQPQILAVLQLTLDGIIDALGENKHIEFRDFGVFQKVERKGRIGRNPNKPENEVLIPNRQVIKFKPGKRMREMLNNPPPTPL
ncbi:MAG: integration host factor subunit beta [Kiritimatiellae bacterium]|nr:integration host factor subunit beta [Kiritimatiellia bacterium]